MYFFPKKIASLQLKAPEEVKKTHHRQLWNNLCKEFPINDSALNLGNLKTCLCLASPDGLTEECKIATGN